MKYAASPLLGQSTAANIMTFYKSTNSGGSWTTYDLPGTEGFAVAADPLNENVVYVGGELSSATYRGVLYKSVNGGTSWTEITGGINNAIYDLAIDPADSNRIYAGTYAGLWRSENAGGSWTKMCSYPALAIAVNRTESAEIYIGGSQGVFFSNNRGATWQDFNGGLTDRNVACLNHDPTNNIIYAGTADAGVFRTSSLMTLSLTSSSGGSTSPAPGSYFYPANASVQITATPNAKHRFTGWTGDASGTANPLTIVMNANKSIQANFERNASTLTVAAGSGGTTTPAPGSYDYAINASVQVTAVPNANWAFTGWTGDATGTANPLTVVMSTDKSLTANFQRIIYAPSNFAGEKKTNRSLLQIEYGNRLTWQNNPSNANIEKHKLYLVAGGLTLVAEIPAQTSEYVHRGVSKSQEYTYALAAVNDEGREGPAAYVTVK